MSLSIESIKVNVNVLKDTSKWRKYEKKTNKMKSHKTISNDCIVENEEIVGCFESHLAKLNKIQ